MFEKAITKIAISKIDDILDEVLGDGDGEFFNDELKDAKALTERLGSGAQVALKAVNLPTVLEHSGTIFAVVRAIIEAVRPYLPELMKALSAIVATVDVEKAKTGFEIAQSAISELMALLSAAAAKKKAAEPPVKPPKK